MNSAQIRLLCLLLTFCFTPRLFAQSFTPNLEQYGTDDHAKIDLFNKPLFISSHYEAVIRHRQDFELDDAAEDDLTRFDQELSIDLYYPFRSNMALFVEVTAAAEIDLQAEDGDEASEEKLELGEAWWLFDQILGSHAALQLGRQNVSETREWWWDSDLDALRLFYDRAPWRLETGIAEQLIRVDSQEEFINPEEEDLLRWFAHVGWDWADKQRLEAFFLAQNDRSLTPVVGDRVDIKQEDESDADLR